MKKKPPLFILGIIIIGILFIILFVVISSILVLKLAPDTIAAYYIRDIITTIQEKVG